MSPHKEIPDLASTYFRIQSVFKNFHSGELRIRMPDGFTGYVWTETVSAKKKKKRCGLKISRYVVWRHIGDIIDSHISWPWKHFFTSSLLLRRVLRLCDRIVFFGAPLVFLPVVNLFRRLLRGCVVFISSCRPFFLSSTLLHI